MLLAVNRHNFKQEVLEAQELVLVNFWANWSEECKRMKRLMRQLDNVLDDGYKIVEINWDADNELAQKLQVYGTPSLLVVDSGRVVRRYSGTMDMKEFFEEIDGAAVNEIPDVIKNPNVN